MGFSLSILILNSLTAVSANAVEPAPLDLKSFVTTSLTRSDSSAVQAATLGASEAALDLAESNYLPALNATVTSSKTGGATSSVSGFGGTVTVQQDDKVTTQSKVNLSQNLFNGLQDRALIRAQTANVDQNKHLLGEANRSQIEEALNRFFGVLSFESDVRNLEKEIELNEKSLKQSQRNVSIGNARRTEVINLQSLISNNEIDLATARTSLEQEKARAARLLKTSRDQIRLIYGEKRFKPEHFDRIVRALVPQDRADFQAQKSATEVSGYNAEVASGKRLPVLDFTASYILSDNQPISQRDQYTLGLSLVIPWPFGMGKNAQVDQARWNHAVARQQEEQKLRDLDRDKGQLIEQLRSDIEQIRKLESARDLGSKNVDAVRKDHQTGLSSYSDVLTAFSTYQQIVRRYDRALLNFELDCYRALIWSRESSKLLSVFEEIR